MAIIGGNFGYHVLMWLQSRKPSISEGLPDEYTDSAHKLSVHFGDDVFERAKGKTIIDFGSGAGRECVEFARQGAKQAIGVELREEFRNKSRDYARQQQVANTQFLEGTDEKADVVYSLDSFEHFEDPAHILRLMSDLVKDDGEIWISFSWSWYHPYGGHLFSVFPWAHLIFSEECLIRWRSHFKDDGATRFGEISGGLNQITIAQFETFIDESELTFTHKRICPIRPLRWLHNSVTREFTTSLISTRLKKKSAAKKTFQAADTPAESAASLS